MTDPAKKSVLHGTAVLLKVKDHPSSAVFLRGPSGSGKSDLAFRLIEEHGGELVGDDQVAFERFRDEVQVMAVSTIRGFMEVRGLGLVRTPPARPSPLHLVVDLVKRADVPRLPEAETVEILGVKLPLMKLHAFDVSSAIKVKKALALTYSPAGTVE